MNRPLRLFAVACLSSGLLVSAAQAQLVQSEIVAPRQNVFTVGTSISVPDRGFSSLGGFGSASHTRHESFPGGGRGIASSAAAQGSTARAWIHNFDELDPFYGGRNGEAAAAAPADGFAARLREYAAAPPSSKARASSVAAGSSADGAGNTGGTAAQRAVGKARELEASGRLVEAARQWTEIRDTYGSDVDPREATRALAALKARPEVAAALQEPRAAELFKRGEDAEARGKPNVARIYYQSAVRLAPAPSAALAEDRLTAIEAGLARAGRAPGHAVR